MAVRSWDISWSVANHQGPERRRPDRGRREGEAFVARLTGFDEVPPVLTPATGSLMARLSEDGSAIVYELRYENLSSSATAAHLHFGPPGVNGEIFAFLCGGEDSPPCGGQSRTVTGEITASDILGIPDQGLADGDLQGALEIMRRGLAYVNVHSQAHPRGEIRGQVRVR